jgi:pilus assembly protein Flp/PilA
MFSIARAFLRDTSGMSAIEYGLISSLVFLTILGTVGALGTKLSSSYVRISTSLS